MGYKPHAPKQAEMYMARTHGAGEAVEGDKERGQLAGLQAEETRRDSRTGEVEREENTRWPRTRQTVWVCAERQEKQLKETRRGCSLMVCKQEETRRESRKREVEPRKRQRVWVSAERMSAGERAEKEM